MWPNQGLNSQPHFYQSIEVEYKTNSLWTALHGQVMITSEVVAIMHKVRISGKLVTIE